MACTVGRPAKREQLISAAKKWSIAGMRASGCRIALMCALIVFTANCSGYSVLTHEELIDLAWNTAIRPLLLARFPKATEAQLREAHAFAYGGSAIQDMGYYPFGKKFFSNLTHYVRTGDFISWLLDNARTIDEYAFAIGALSHYYGDAIGHSEAIDPATAIEFPKLRKEYGDSVTYGESPHSHIRTEFAFDIDELTDTAFAPPSYLHYIGFRVPRRFLERAFVSTYGFDIHDVLGQAHPALRSYATSVRKFIPAFAEAEVVLHRHQFPRHPDSPAYHTFLERVARTNYERSWKHPYRGPGFKAHLLAIVVFLVPKIGGASDLAIKIPTQDTEEKYLRSVNRTVDQLNATVHKLMPGARTVELENIDLDTGIRVKLGDYRLADETYAHWLERLTSRPGRTVHESLKEHILNYYKDYETAGNAEPHLQEELAILRGMKVAGASKKEPPRIASQQ